MADLDARQRADERYMGEQWFDSLPYDAKWQLGDELVLGAFEWFEWFDCKPSAAFMRGADNKRILWEQALKV